MLIKLRKKESNLNFLHLVNFFFGTISGNSIYDEYVNCFIVIKKKVVLKSERAALRRNTSIFIIPLRLQLPLSEKLLQNLGIRSKVNLSKILLLLPEYCTVKPKI